MPNLSEFHQKGANGMANSEDPDQSSLIWVCTVCSDLSVQKLSIITVPATVLALIFMGLSKEQQVQCQYNLTGSSKVLCVKDIKLQ